MADPKRDVTLVQDPDPAKEVPLEVLAKAITEIAAAAQKLTNGPLAKRAVLVLLQDAIKGQISLATIEAVLDAAASLERRYVRR